LPILQRISKKKTTAEFVSEASRLHLNKYDYSRSDYIGDGKKVEIICKKHGSFWMCPKEHLRLNQGCSKCWRDKLTYTTEEFIDKAKLVHGDRYDYTASIYTHNQSKIKIKCEQHGEFQQKAKDHLLGCGCQKCNKKISKVEIKFLNEIGIPEEFRQYPIPNTKYQVDGYDPENNTVYEFLGDHWHGNPEIKNQDKPIYSLAKTTFGDLYRKTIEKFENISNMGYKINYIWENDWKKWLKNRNEKLPILEYKK
jgi:hypothetical protein